MFVSFLRIDYNLLLLMFCIIIIILCSYISNGGSGGALETFVRSHFLTKNFISFFENFKVLIFSKICIKFRNITINRIINYNNK